MRLTRQSLNGTVVVVVTGDVDLDTSPRLHDFLRRLRFAPGLPVVVDLSGVGRLDSSGVATLLEGLRRARREKTDLRLVGPSDDALRMLHLAGVEGLFGVHASVAEAVGGGRSR